MEKAPQLLARLGDMAKEAGPKAFERVALAALVLQDREWVFAAHGGSESLAREYLEAEFFGDLCGAVTLDQLLEIHRTFPDQQRWAEHKYNLPRLWIAVKALCPKNEKPKVERKGPVPSEVHEQVLAEKKAVHERNEKLARVNKEIIEELERLRKENEELRSEVARLRRELVEVTGAELTLAG